MGQRGKLLDIRSKEHKDNVKRNKNKHNVVTKLIKEFSEERHDMSWNNSTIFHKESNWKKLCVAGMYYIKKRNTVLRI